MPWPTKKIGEVITFIVFILFAIAFFVVCQFWQSFLTLSLLLILLKLDELRRLVISPKSGLEADFHIPEENIERDIEENNAQPDQQTFAHFRQVEERILNEVQRNIGGVMKKQINFMYGMLDKPEFVYRPDATIQTEKELIFIEVKYVLRPEFAPRIVENAVKYLKTILEKFGPVAGKKLIAKVVLASNYDLDLKSLKVPEGIELEFYKL